MLSRSLDPEGPFVKKWNKLVLICCLTAVGIDPLLAYIHVVDAARSCLYLDEKFAITICFLRTLVDAFYAFHIFLKFRTGFIAPLHSRVATVIAIRAKINLVRIRPFTLLTIAQNLVRAVRMVSLLKEVSRASGISTVWAGAASNFFFYMLGSHVIGSLWYLFTVERADTCWRLYCAKNYCEFDEWYCGRQRGPQGSIYFHDSPCLPPQSREAALFDYGIFFDHARKILLDPDDFFGRFFHCFVWGLRNLSSLGQSLETSTHRGDNLFVVVISATGLILFSILAGNIQRYLQFFTAREDEMRMKLQDHEIWMSHSRLPPELRVRIRQHEQHKWQKSRGVDEESLIRDLPKDLRRDIKRHQCRSLLITVPMFKKMDGMQLDALCCRLKPVLYTADTYIFHEGDPVDEMLFIMRGNILTTTTNGGRSGFFNAVWLMAGDFCGEELLTWALDPNSSSTLPISTRTVQAVKDVEAFCLMPDDLKSVASQFRRLPSKQLQYTFRFYSQQWRSWGACFIQAAWRRHYRRKMQMALHAPSLGAAIYASRFASNMMGNLRRRHQPHNNMSSPRLATLLPQKPSEPDFSA